MMLPSQQPTQTQVIVSPYVQYTPWELALLFAAQFLIMTLNFRYMCGLFAVQLVLGVLLIGIAYFWKQHWPRFICTTAGMGCGFLYALVMCAVASPAAWTTAFCPTSHPTPMPTQIPTLMPTINGTTL